MSDHHAFIELERDATVQRYVNGPSIKTDDEFFHGLRSYVPSATFMVIADAATDLYVGRCGLIPIRGSNDVELFVLLAQSSQRQGIGQIVVTFLVKLSRELNKEPIGIVDPENLASRAMLETLGMVIDGTVTATGYQNGHIRYRKSGR